MLLHLFGPMLCSLLFSKVQNNIYSQVSSPVTSLLRSLGSQPSNSLRSVVDKRNWNIKIWLKWSATGLSPGLKWLATGLSPGLKWLATGLVHVIFHVSQVFLEAGVEGASCIADVEFSTFGAENSVHNVVCPSVELLGDVHLGFWSMDADVGADAGAHFAFLLVARSGSWCSGVISCVFWSVFEYATYPSSAGMSNYGGSISHELCSGQTCYTECWMHSPMKCSGHWLLSPAKCKCIH